MENSENGHPAEATQERYWQAHFERWRESGLTQSEYCRQAELSRHRFKYWRRKLDTTMKRRRKKPSSDLVPVQVHRSTPEPSLSLSLANGMELRGIDAGNIDLVRRLIAQL